jgi:hypothetical protein
MKKQFTITLAFAAASFLLSALPVAAQGRSSGHDAGAGSAGTHEPMGMGSHGAASGADTSTAKGPKTPDELLAQNSKLSDSLQKLLPGGMTAQQACQNYKNLGQCVAAIHVAKNLGIDFGSLTCDMTLKPVAPATSCPTGTGTGTKGMSLGASIQALDPTLSQSQLKSETKKAQHQAQTDLSHS